MDSKRSKHYILLCKACNTLGRSAGGCGLEVYAGPVCLDLSRMLRKPELRMNCCPDEVMPLPEWNSEDVDLSEWKLLLKS